MEFLTYIFLPAAGLLLLLCAAFGNTRVFLSAFWGLLAFGISAGLAILIAKAGNMGWGALLLIPVVIGIGVVVFLRHLLRSQFGKNAVERATLPAGSRRLAASVGVLCLVACLVLVNWDDIGDRAYRRAIANGNTTLLAWCLKTWDSDYAAWSALTSRDPGPETLRLIAFLVSSSESDSYFSTAWDLLSRQPSGPERLEVARELQRRRNTASIESLLAFYDQKDAETFDLILQTADPRWVLSSLADSERYDVAREVTRRALARGDSGRLPQEMLDGLRLYDFLPDPELFAELLAAGVAPNTQDHYDRSTLLRALRAGDEKAVRLLLSAGADPCLPDLEGRDALFYAIVFNREAFFAPFLNACPNLARRDKAGLTALHWAAWFGNSGMVEQLLARGVPADADTPPDLPTPLFYAVQGGGPQTLDLLLRLPEGRRPNPMARSDTGEPTVLAVKGIPVYRLCNALESIYGADFPEHAYDLPPLTRAYGFQQEDGPALERWRLIQTRKTKVAARLLQAGADASRALPNGDTVLHVFFNTPGLDDEMSEHPLEPESSGGRDHWCRDSFERVPTVEAALQQEYGGMLDALLAAGAAPEGATAEEICSGAVLSQRVCLEVVSARLNRNGISRP